MMLANLSRERIEHLPKFGTVRENDKMVLVPCLENSFAIWMLKDDVSLTPSIREHNFWESWITSWFTYNVKPGHHIVDIGANAGYFTMLFERLVGEDGFVTAFECNPNYVMALRMTAKFNEAKFKLVPVAVSDRPGHTELIYPGEYTGSASIVHGFDKKWGEEHKVLVPTTTLDYEFYGKRSPDLIKIDAESAEEVIWNGAESLLAREDAPVGVMEYSPTGVYTEEFPDKLFAYGNVTRINYEGKEEPITPDYLKSLEDWDMLVIRRK